MTVGTATLSPQQHLIGGADRRSGRYERVWRLLNGGKLVKRAPQCDYEVHRAIVDGIPQRCLVSLMARFKVLGEADIPRVLDMSTRALNRCRQAPDRPMSIGLASKVWALAETLVSAAEVFGTELVVEAWMSKPALGLNGQRPIDLLRTSHGTQIVEDFLTRLEYGVYT